MIEPGSNSTNPPLSAGTGSPFAALVEHERDRATVYLAGGLDLATAPAFEGEVLALLAQPLDAVALDLVDLSFVDSSGLRALNAIRMAAVARDVTLMLQNVPPRALRTLDLCGMAGLFSMVPPVSVGAGPTPPEHVT